MKKNPTMGIGTEILRCLLVAWLLNGTSCKGGSLCLVVDDKRVREREREGVGRKSRGRGNLYSWRITKKKTLFVSLI